MARYVREKLIGVGAFSEVYRCREEVTGRTWALKILKPEATDEDKRRFAREVRMQAQMAHPHIVRIVATGLNAERPFFVMALAEQTFEAWCDPGSDVEIVRVLGEALDALAYAHSQGVVHRDIKPTNILLHRSPKTNMLHALVADFGLGVLLNRDTTTITRTYAAVGSIAYMSPEQAEDAKSVDHRTDIYSLGKVLYWALTKRVPFPEYPLDRLPVGFRHIVKKACAHERGNRYQSALEFKTALEAVVADVSPFTPQYQDVQRMHEAIRTGADEPALRTFATTLFQSRDDTQVLSQVVPQISQPLLRRLVAIEPEIMRSVLDAYDESVSGGLPFNYCDTVADFYERLWLLYTDSEVRGMLLSRLLRMGHGHNRFYVRGVIDRMFEQLKDPGVITMTADLLRAHPEIAKWMSAGTQPDKWPKIIRNAVAGGAE